jgi:sugar lactone lactonase YvrE
MARAALALLFLVGCGTPGSDSPTVDGGGGTDAGSADGSAATDAPAATFIWPTCGTTAFDHFELYYGHAIAVAPDGTVFHQMSDGGESYIGRYRPGMTGEPTWAHLGVAATSVISLTTDAAGTPYALIGRNGQTQLARVTGGTAPAITAIGPTLTTIGGPNAIAFAPDGALFEAGFQGLARVNLATGQRTTISQPIQLRELYFTGASTARGVSYDHGLVELTIGASAATFTTIFPFTTLALQYTGLDQMGRTYALIHEMSKDKLVRFDPTFANRDTLYEYPSVSIALGRFAFGRGALRCDVLVTGFNIAHVTTGDTPAVP